MRISTKHKKKFDEYMFTDFELRLFHKDKLVGRIGLADLIDTFFIRNDNWQKQ